VQRRWLSRRDKTERVPVNQLALVKPSLEEDLCDEVRMCVVKGIILTILAVTILAGGACGDGRRVVCYYANWAVYRQGGARFTPQNINPYLCTHLIYAFGGISNADTIQPFDKYQDIEKGGYARFAALKTFNRDLKTMLAIGGWNEGSRRFSPLVADPDRRQVFVRSAVRFLRQYNFDGLDLDWEYPTQRQGGRAEDKENYAILVDELRDAFEKEADKTGKERLLLSMAVPASLEIAGEGYAIGKLDNSLDFFNLLTYDYHSAHEPAVNHHAPLYRPEEWSEFDYRKDLNIDATIKFYVQNGASRNKLVLGIPTYGRSYTLANFDAYDIDSPATGPGEAGADTKEDGYLAYYEICEKIIDDGWQMETMYPGIMGPYAHSGNQWVGFDDVDIAVEKAFYVADEGLGGIMFWTVDNDDFRGSCGETPFPLIESAKEAMFSVQISDDAIHRFSPTESSRKKIERPAEPIRKEPLRSFTRTDFHSVSVTTPAPPTTPQSEPVFSCRTEGFYAHPATCKKYFWCLDTPAQGMVAHKFSCPKGLYFNTNTEGCDFLRNVNCGDKDITEVEKVKSELEENAISNSDPILLKERVNNDSNEKHEKESNKESEERRLRISTKTKSRLSQLLNRGRPPKRLRYDNTSKSREVLLIPKIGEEKDEDELKNEKDNKKETISTPYKTRLSQFFNRRRPQKLRGGGDNKKTQKVSRKEQENQTEQTSSSPRVQLDKVDNQIRTKTSVSFSTSEVTRVERLRLTKHELERLLTSQRETNKNQK